MMGRPFYHDLRRRLARLPRLTWPPPLARQAIATLLARLSPRERRLVGGAGVTVCGIVLYLLVIDPVWQWHARLSARVAAKERELQELIALRQTYLTLRREVERTRLMSETHASPFAFLEGLATATVGREKVTAINPAGRETRNGVSQETIELRLKGVTLRELVELLYKMESAGVALRTVQISMRKAYKNPYAFDVALTNVALDPR
ncbi:MAG: type II secretion system protein GspM [Thermodesulfobacteriota bacterium]